jgi:hypothetical protein
VCSKPAPKDFALLARQVAVLQHLLGATAAYRSTPAEVDDPSALLAAAGGNTLTTMTTTMMPGGGWTVCLQWVVCLRRSCVT